MAKVKDTEWFVIAAIEKHGKTYDYSETNFNGSKFPITIICRKCGPFVVKKAEDHYRSGRLGGCRNCESAFARNAKRKCSDCGGAVTKKSIRCFDCNIRFRLSKGEEVRIEKELARQKSQDQRRLANEETANATKRFLPIAGHVVPCSECGKKVVKKKVTERNYCSINCRWRSLRRKRRAIKNRAFVEAVDLNEIANRDKWVCKLCGKKVQRNAKYNRQATLDHVIPLSKGGLHEVHNCQLAHFDCNSRKHNKVTTLF